MVMSEAEAVRRRLEPYYVPSTLPDVFVDRLVYTLQQRNVADKLESFLTATEGLLARLLEVWHIQGIQGFPLRLGSYALLHLVQPPLEFLAEDGDFLFCVGIRAFGTLSLKFCVNGKVHSSTVNKSDYAKIWSTDFYKRLLRSAHDYANRLFTKAVLYDLEKCIYVYKSLEDIISECSLHVHKRPVSVLTYSKTKMENSGAAEKMDWTRSCTGSMDTEFGKQTDEKTIYREKIMDLCERLSQLLRDDSTEHKNWRHLACDLLQWDFAECKAFEKENDKDPIRAMLAKFIHCQRSHRVHSEKWIYCRLVFALHRLGRDDIFLHLSNTSLSTPTEKTSPVLRRLTARESLPATRKCLEPNLKDDNLLAARKSEEPISSLAEDMYVSLQAKLAKQDEISSEKNVLLSTWTLDLKDLQLVSSDDDAINYQGQGVPIYNFRQYQQMHPSKQHHSPYTDTQWSPGQRVSGQHHLPAAAELPTKGGYPEPMAAIMFTAQELPSAGTQHPDHHDIVPVAVSQKIRHPTVSNSADIGYPPVREAIEEALDEARRTRNLPTELDGHHTTSSG